MSGLRITHRESPSLDVAGKNAGRGHRRIKMWERAGRANKEKLDLRVGGEFMGQAEGCAWPETRWLKVD